MWSLVHEVPAAQESVTQEAVLSVLIPVYNEEATVAEDADLEYDPAEIPDVIAPILAGHADVVYGSRFLCHAATLA